MPRFTGMLVIGLLIGWFLYWSAPAKAYDDCAADVKGQLISRAQGVLTLKNLIKYRKKKDTDVYQLLAMSVGKISPVAKITTSTSAIAVLNCAAIKSEDGKAMALRKRLANSIDEYVEDLRADRIQPFYINRLRNGTPGQKQLLSADERQLWADILAYAGEQEPTLENEFAALAIKINLPTPTE